jgi:hypothetical protein
MGSKEVLVLGSTQCSQKIDVDIIIMIPSPKEILKNKCKGTHELINMNRTINTHTHSRMRVKQGDHTNMT